MWNDRVSHVSTFQHESNNNSITFKRIYINGNRNFIKIARRKKLQHAFSLQMRTAYDLYLIDSTKKKKPLICYQLNDFNYITYINTIDAIVLICISHMEFIKSTPIRQLLNLSYAELKKHVKNDITLNLRWSSTCHEFLIVRDILSLIWRKKNVAESGAQFIVKCVDTKNLAWGVIHVPNHDSIKDSNTFLFEL